MADYYVDASLGSNGTGTQSDPFNNLQSAMDAGLAAGDNIYATGTETLTDTVTAPGVDGTTDARIGLYGCDSSWNVGAAQYVLDAGPNSLSKGFTPSGTFDYWDVYNITFRNATTACVDLDSQFAHNTHWHQCIMENSGDAGMDGYRGGSMQFSQCVFQNNAGSGVRVIYNGEVTFAFCRFVNNDLGDSQYYTGHKYFCCLFAGQTDRGVSVDEMSIVVNCVFDDNALGVELFADAKYTWLFGNRFTNNTTALNINGDTENRGYAVANAYYGNNSKWGSTYGFIFESDSVDMSSEGYVDRANDDYNLTDSAEGRSIGVNVYWDS